MTRSLFLGYDARGRPIRLSPDDRKIHMHCIGSSGSGKSRFLEWMIRGDLKNRQGFCLIDPHGELYDTIVSYCARHVLDREIILLNLSEPDSVVGFNPFRKNPDGDISVQVDRRTTATMHAWGVENTDETQVCRIEGSLRHSAPRRTKPAWRFERCRQKETVRNDEGPLGREKESSEEGGLTASLLLDRIQLDHDTTPECLGGTQSVPPILFCVTNLDVTAWHVTDLGGLA